MVSVMGCVSIVKSDSRFEGVRKALSLISDDLRAKIDGYRKLLIKPNFVSVRRLLSATPVESVDALIEALKKSFNKPIKANSGDQVALKAVHYASSATDLFGSVIGYEK